METNTYWNSYYEKKHAPATPSSFAEWVYAKYLPDVRSIVELGCGNGRDSRFFLSKDLKLTAIDRSVVAVNTILSSLSPDELQHGRFIPQDFSSLDTVEVEAQVAYSRFVLHAIPENVEDALLDFCSRVVQSNNKMFHEFRTIRDPLMQRGKNLGGNARFTDHYRRFIDPDALIAKIRRRGWRIDYFEERQGFATLGADDPVVARVVATKM